MTRWTAAAAALLMLAGCGKGGETEQPAPGSAEPAALESEAPETSDAGELFAVDATSTPGKVLFHLPAPGDDGVMLRLIHSAGLTAGLGSNPVGLDRGYADGGRIIVFRKVGPRIVIEQENLNYRATADNPLEREAVAQSFARSFLWAGDAAEELDGAVAVDVSGFLTSDILSLEGVLDGAGQGAYALDAGRSFVDPASTFTFPDNVEIDVFQTFSAKKPGGEVAATAADGRQFTVTLHHSFVRLPKPGYEMRDYDTRSGAIDVPYYDFSAALDEPVTKRLARRFRLERVDPKAESGPVKKPIVFYVDPGAPEPVRSALIEGASWWSDAFRAAGFEDAYRVELLPEGAHPMDIRYNIIQWVHRQTRGWSYGGGVADPRTGEMLKAHVVLGSQRVRQDRMIFEGLAGAGKTGTGAADDPVVIALARIRQLSAHEVGHTLGFAHNFAASANDRASVMDYPAPLVTVGEGGELDFSEAYDSGIGAWDKVAATWLYGEFGDGEKEKKALNAVLDKARADGLLFIDDAQGRPTSGAHPAASVWDNGSDPVAALNDTMDVRRVALSKFGSRSLKAGEPTSELAEVIVPIFLYHRYQVAAAAKLVGGYDFRYAVKGDGPARGAPVPAGRQRAALDALLATLDPAALDLPDATLNLLTTEVGSFAGNAPREVFASDAGAMFDPLTAADIAAGITLRALLHPERSARLIEMERRDSEALSYEEVLAAIEARVFAAPAAPRQAEIARRIQARFVATLIEAASGGGGGGESRAATLFLSFGPGATASPAVRARTDGFLRSLRSRLQPGLFAQAEPEARAHNAWLASLIDAHFEDANRTSMVASPPTPPGSPIGMTEECWFCDLD